MSAFRPIRPSSNASSPADGSVAPQSSANGAASASSSAHLANGGSGDDRAAGSGPRSRKRRAPSHVSQNACTNCKKARAKCDGNEPHPCQRCIARDMGDQCHYEVHVKTQKEEMVRKIRSLEKQNHELQSSMEEKENHINAIFEALRDNDQGPEALARLRAGQSYQQIVSWLGHPPYADVARLSPGSETKLTWIVQQYEASVSHEPHATETETANGKRWTAVTNNAQLIHHLMALYFSWVHPAHMLFSEWHFMKSFNDGDRVYCSPALVNVMCAMGCFHLVDQGGNDAQAKELEKRFLDQALHDIAEENPGTLTYASTYAILFLAELSARQARKATSHLRVAVESLSKISPSAYDKDAVELAAWGIHSLNTIWATMTYQKHSSPLHPPQMSNSVALDGPYAKWQPYRFPQDKFAHQVPSRAIETAREMSRLTRIVYDMINTYYGNKESVTARAIMSLYQRYLDWKSSLSAALNVSFNTASYSYALPHVLFLHAIYHVALCQLFRPLLEFEELPSTTRSHFHEITLQSALDGLRLLELYKEQYTCRYQSPMLAFGVVHICETVARAGPAVGDARKRAIKFALRATHEALPGFLCVGPLQFMFCQVVTKEGLSLPKNFGGSMGGRTEYGAEDLLDTCERLTYTQPGDWLHDRVNRSLGTDFVYEWQRFIEARGRSSSSGSGMVKRESSDSTQRLTDRSGSLSSAGGSTTSARSMQINSVVNP